MDLRIQKTYRALNGAFTELLSQNRYEKISVSKICDAALIRRTTFYKHFRDKDDFFAFYIDSLRQEFLAFGDEDGEGAGALGRTRASRQETAARRREILARLSAFLLAHREVMGNIFTSSMAGAMITVIDDAMAQALRERYGAEKADASEFAAGGISRLMLLWWHNGQLERDEEAFINAASTYVGRIMED